MMYTIEEVARILKVSEATVRSLIKKRQLRAVRVGAQLRIKQEDLDEYLRNQYA